MATGGKSTYNERFCFDDPASFMSASRVTRYRTRKKQRVQEEENEESLAITSDIANDIDMAADVFDSDMYDHCLGDLQDVNESETRGSDALTDTVDHEEFVDWSNPGDVDPDCNNYEEADSDHHQKENEVYTTNPITRGGSNIAIMHYKMRHNLTDEALSDLLKLMTLHSQSSPHASSLYQFNKYFSQNNWQTVNHYYCSSCLQKASECDEVCTNSLCSSDFSVQGAKCCFIELPIENQLLTLFKREGFYATLVPVEQRKSRGNMYSDIYDGSVYQSLESQGYFTVPSNLSLILNTDGIPVFKSSNYAFWPIYLLINELPYNKRVANCNQIFAGLWFGSTKADMALFLKPVVDSLLKLYHTGIEVYLPCEKALTCRCALICVSVDLPARSSVCNFVQFNGYWGCSKCLQKGTRISTGERGAVQTYPYIVENPCGPARTDKDTCNHAQDALKNDKNTPVFGVKGPSWLTLLPTFDLIGGMSIDYMHCCLLGVCRQLLRLWIQSSHHGNEWYIGNKVHQLDERLCSINPPEEMQRTPRSIETTLPYWKAHELRAWLIHYSPVVLYGILPDTFYQHHLLFVEAIYLLLQGCITSADVQKSEKLLKHYCFMFSTLYGERYMSANIHSLLHLPDCVRKLGPLWAHSCFPFESANGHLLKLFHGSQGVEKQVIQRITTEMLLPVLAQSELPPDSREYQFCSKMMDGKHFNKPLKKISDTLSVQGALHATTLSDDERKLFSDIGYVSLPTEVYSCRSLRLCKALIVAQSRSKATKRNDSCMAFKKGYGLASKIFGFGEPFQVFVLVKEFQAEECVTLCTDDITYANLSSHYHVFKDCTFTYRIISGSEVIAKCVFLDLGKTIGSIFVSLLPNHIELE